MHELPHAGRTGSDPGQIENTDTHAELLLRLRHAGRQHILMRLRPRRTAVRRPLSACPLAECIGMLGPQLILLDLAHRISWKRLYDIEEAGALEACQFLFG